MAIYDKFLEKYNDDPKVARRTSAQKAVDDLEDKYFEDGTQESLEALREARRLLKEQEERRDAREAAKDRAMNREEVPTEPDQGMAQRILAAYAGKDPEIQLVLEYVTNSARGAWTRRTNKGTVMDLDDFVQQGTIICLELLHGYARSGRPIPGPHLVAASVVERLKWWQKEEKWAQNARPGNHGPNPEPGDPYSMEELRWALQDLHNPENWHDPLILGSIKKIQNPAYRQALEAYFESPKPKVDKNTLSRARTVLLYEMNMEAPPGREGCCPDESRDQNHGNCVCLGDGPGTRQVMTNYSAYWKLVHEAGFEEHKRDR